MRPLPQTRGTFQLVLSMRQETITPKFLDEHVGIHSIVYSHSHFDPAMESPLGDR
jgi:hypothetical protein